MNYHCETCTRTTLPIRLIEAQLASLWTEVRDNLVAQETGDVLADAIASALPCVAVKPDLVFPRNGVHCPEWNGTECHRDVPYETLGDVAAIRLGPAPSCSIRFFCLVIVSRLPSKFSSPRLVHCVGSGLGLQNSAVTFDVVPVVFCSFTASISDSPYAAYFPILDVGRSSHHRQSLGASRPAMPDAAERSWSLRPTVLTDVCCPREQIVSRFNASNRLRLVSCQRVCNKWSDPVARSGVGSGEAAIAAKIS